MKSLKASLIAVIVLCTAAAADVRQITLPAKDLVYDPSSGKIYASVPGTAGSTGNSIRAIDPVTGDVGAPIFIGSEPGKLALSDNGQYLYVALDGAAAVRRLDLVPRTAGPQFPLGSDSFFGPYYVEDMEVLPGQPQSVAISRKNLGISPRHAGVAIYDNGVPRPKATERHTGSNVIELSASPSRLYGYNNETTEFGFRRMAVDASGVTVADVTPSLITGFGVDIRFDRGLVFTTSGRVIDPEARTLLGTFSGIGFPALVAPDVAAGRVFYLTGDGPTRKLQIFDPRTFLSIGSMDITGVNGTASSLIRWGQERSDAGGGLAFRTSSDQLFLIRVGTPSPLTFSVTVQPATVDGGASATGTVTLSGPAPAGGAVVLLTSSNPAAAAVPASVTVPAGATMASFSVTTRPVQSAVPVVISASYAGATQPSIVTVVPGGLAGISLDPPEIIGGSNATGSVVLSAPAAPGGAVVTLSSSNQGAATVPASVTVPGGASRASFPVATRPVNARTDVRITASFAGTVQSATLAVLPFGIRTLTLQPTTIVGGASVSATITFSAPVPADVLIITLRSSNPAVAAVQDSIRVVRGVSAVNFTVTTRPVTSPTPVVISAQLDGVSQSATLTVLPGGFAAVSVQPTSVVGGAAANGTVTLSGPAPPGGAVVTLSSSNAAAAAVPPTVRVPAGATTATFPVTTRPVAATINVVLSATYAGVTGTATLQVLRLLLESITVTPSAVRGGEPTIGTVTLSALAPEGGFTVGLSTKFPDLVKLPPYAFVPAGSIAASFPIATQPVTTATLVPIWGARGQVRTAHLWLLPVGISLTPASVRGGQPTWGTIVLSDPAPPGGAIVLLASANPAVATVPPMVVVPPGANEAIFPIKTSPVKETTPVVLVAVSGGTIWTNAVTVVP